MNTVSLWAMCAAALVPALAGCGGGARPVPDVRDEPLDLAEETLEDAGLDYDVTGGGTFGVVVRSNWQVCFQHPAPGRRAASVELVVARACPRTQARRRAPDVVGLRLDVAERELVSRRVEYYVYPDDEVIIRTNWTACGQSPPPGRHTNAVELYVEHFSCETDDDD